MDVIGNTCAVTKLLIESDKAILFDTFPNKQGLLQFLADRLYRKYELINLYMPIFKLLLRNGARTDSKPDRINAENRTNALKKLVEEVEFTDNISFAKAAVRPEFIVSVLPLELQALIHANLIQLT